MYSHVDEESHVGQRLVELWDELGDVAVGDFNGCRVLVEYYVRGVTAVVGD